VKHLVTDDLYQGYQDYLDIMKEEQICDVLENIMLHQISVLSLKDQKDDAKDRVSIYLKGIMVDYTISEINGNIRRNVSRSMEAFADIYYFSRKGDMWMLDYIDNNPDGLDFVVAKRYREK
jgi:hypothetical protein